MLSRKYIDEHAIVARYLADQLSEPERQRFEAYSLEHPELFDEINQAATLKAGLLHLAEAGELEPLLATRPRRNRVFTWSALAACLIAAVGVAVWFVDRSAPPLLAGSVAALAPRGEPLPIAQSYILRRTRNAAYDAVIAMPATSAAVELRFKPRPPAIPPRYRASLAAMADDGSMAPVGILESVTPAADGFITIYLHATRLPPGTYALTVAGITGGQSADPGPYLLELVAAEQR